MLRSGLQSAPVGATVPVIVRVTPTVHWHALDDDEVAGRAYALHRPDHRVFVSIDTWREEVFPALAGAVIADLHGDLYTRVDEADAAELARWASVGFDVHRREDEYLLPTAPEATGLGGAAFPPGFWAVSADAADEDRLRTLDEVLRGDVPGSDGWVNDPQQFHDQSFDPRYFDPATYLVAMDGGGLYVGLVRVGSAPHRGRLGLIGVVSAYRRRGLARALLAAAFAQLHARGISHVTAEADTTNTASAALLATIGARRTGGSVELRYAASPAPRRASALLSGIAAVRGASARQQTPPMPGRARRPGADLEVSLGWLPDSLIRRLGWLVLPGHPDHRERDVVRAALLDRRLPQLERGPGVLVVMQDLGERFGWHDVGQAVGADQVEGVCRKRRAGQVGLDRCVPVMPAERLRDDVPEQRPAPRRPVVHADLLEPIRHNVVDPAVADVEGDQPFGDYRHTGYRGAHRGQFRVVCGGLVQHVVALVQHVPDRLLAIQRRTRPRQVTDDQPAGQLAAGVPATRLSSLLSRTRPTWLNPLTAI